MKRFEKLSLWPLLMATLIFGLFACTADLDEFGTSDYKEFGELYFEEQEGAPEVYSGEHRMVINLQALPESLSVWDSVTVQKIDVSHFATLHLVESKIFDFPSDSLALDSLAEKVAYSEKRLKKGSRIRLPMSQKVYLAVVSESGKPSIWEIQFKTPGVTSSEESSSSSDIPSSSSSAILNDDVSLSLEFESALEYSESNDTLYVLFANGFDLSKAVLESVLINRKSSISPDPKSVKDWSKPQKFTVEAEDGSTKTWVVACLTQKNSGTDFQITLEDQFKIQYRGDTIYVKLENGTSIEKAKLSAWSISSGASISPSPDSIKTWKEYQTFEVVSESGKKRTFVLALSVAAPDEKVSDEKALLSISAAGEVREATIDTSSKTVTLHLPNAQALASVDISIEISPTASHNLNTAGLDLRSEKTFRIFAEDGSFDDWKLVGEYEKSSIAEILTFETEDFESEVSIDFSAHLISFAIPYGEDLSCVYFSATYSPGAKKISPTTNCLDLTSGKAKIELSAEDGTSVTWDVEITQKAPAPKILSLKIAGKNAIINEEKHSIHVDSLSFRTDLTSLELSEISLSEGASLKNFSVGGVYDFSHGQTLVVENVSGEKVIYVVKAGYQLPGSDFNTWSGNDMMPDSVWDNANTVATTTKKYTSGSLIGAEIKTTSVLGKIASGSLYTAVFNPNNVGTFDMASSSTWPDGNELLDFGKPFLARPEYVEFKLKYEGKGDSLDAYVLLENRTGNKNVNRTASDVNKLVGSAWFRSTKSDESSRPNPDLVSISEEDQNGMRTIRLKFKYGKPLASSPIEESSIFDTTLKSKDSKAVDNGLIEGSGEEAVTHIRVVLASSADGNHYKGASGAVLIVDEMRLIYGE